ncbi:oxygenase MpaB family protein [Actinomadura madurae]|uniref:oxygenase MpaB family protein n=2 Tax=Actinomadura madurae TaxID=1993 RepID=UPI0020274D16|nr:oxygenase MpaB family protein [Actinomadura madurae]MCP9951268.1 oxygenase MpaB family protein [Actinomadura madurae]MCP9968038.1 oxygenase MpaB family protein [Actinomadura madurae]MCQ0007989.1 oxygenase MpaB family protein [Actinomadura madurae]URM96786.1 oxygenase MpaB family protein [Actinomadura madurae]URN07472.1 oxygenase MpaB family protein [Actinomadura madurae]
MTTITEETPPKAVLDSISGIALAAAASNVVMQLARLPVGHGVAESTVDSGRVDKHPVKRARTTLSYIAVAMLGTESERLAMRREVNRAHRGVNAKAPVAYNAFDRELQLWVAACLYQGIEMIYTLLYGEPSPEQAEEMYRYGARFGTTLQVPQDMWPPDRAAFEDYWQAGVAEIEMDDVTRGYLRDLTDLRLFPAPLRWVLGRHHRFLTLGFLPQPFRDELGYPWTARDQARFDRYTRFLARTNRVLPRPAREFPFNLYLHDVRRRIRKNRPIV